MDFPRFELAKGYDDINLLPRRATKFSAGYDFVVARDIVVPSFSNQMEILNHQHNNNILSGEKASNIYMLDEMSALTKATKAKPTLVPTGVKAYIPKGYYLQLQVRSSCPLKNWLILANGVGIIDSDYYSNPDNDGEIFFQLINLSPFQIILNKGDKIGQGIFIPFQEIENDEAAAKRIGGFGSTGP